MSKSNSGAGRQSRAGDSGPNGEQSASGDRSAIDTALFNDTDIKVVYGSIPDPNVDMQQMVDQLATDMFGRTVTEKELINLVAPPDGATVTIETDGFDLTFRVEHPLYRSYKREVFRNMAGELEMHNDYFFLESHYVGQDPVSGEHIWKTDAPKGYGATVFSRQVVAARKLGIGKISVFGIRSDATALRPGANGYYTWPRFGYNGKLPSFRSLVRDNSPAHRPPSHTESFYTHEADFRSLMSSETGRTFWRKYGNDMDGTFDTARSSQSSSDLRRYLLESGLSSQGV